MMSDKTTITMSQKTFLKFNKVKIKYLSNLVDEGIMPKSSNDDFLNFILDRVILETDKK